VQFVSIEASSESSVGGINVVDQQLSSNNHQHNIVTTQLELTRHHQLVAGLKNLIEKLPPKERQITTTFIDLLTQKFDSNESLTSLNQEVAKKLNITASNVGTVIARVRTKMRIWLHSESQHNSDLPRIWQDLLDDIDSKSDGRRNKNES
jgi:hypothetical protein